MSKRRGFTLVELMLVVVIIGVLLAIGVAKYQTMVSKSNDASTKGNLSALRSALSIYYGDNEQLFPLDDLSSLTLDAKYVPAVPVSKVLPFHSPSNGVVAEITPSDSGEWSYDNDPTDTVWGRLVVGCTHQDHSGVLWTSY